ncbi:MAG: NAD-dependent epimerase/dehydratase family protein [Burkholderiaceae bacterium]|nr:NAD-dependent epimerase/dehydratase family protein [Burkholderiaceae bacterium]
MEPLLLTGHRGYLGACVAAVLTRVGVPHRVLATRLQEIAPASLDVSGVIHCAGPLRHRGDAVQMDGHCDGTRALLRGLTRPVPVVYVSSRSIYGRASAELLNETVLAAPVDAYGGAKLAAEVSIHESGAPHVILRCSTLIGMGVDQDGHSFLRQALHRLRAGETVTRYLPDRPHDALDVWAAAQACVEVSQSVHGNETFNLAGPARSLHATLDALSTACGALNRLRDKPDPSASWGVLDGSRFRDRYPTWQPRTDAALFGAWVAGLRLSAGS